MDKQIRRIGVLTSGGDAPGMNALIRSVVRSASANDISVLGIRRGYSGLINGDIIEMGARSVDGIIRKGSFRPMPGSTRSASKRTAQLSSAARLWASA